MHELPQSSIEAAAIGHYLRTAISDMNSLAFLCSFSASTWLQYHSFVALCCQLAKACDVSIFKWNYINSKYVATSARTLTLRGPNSQSFVTTSIFTWVPDYPTQTLMLLSWSDIISLLHGTFVLFTLGLWTAEFRPRKCQRIFSGLQDLLSPRYLKSIWLATCQQSGALLRKQHLIFWIR